MLKRHLTLAYFLIFAGCGPSNIGTTCSSKGDCGGGKHPICAPGLDGASKICTHVCITNADCPFAYDCTITDASAGKTCNKALYATDAKTGDPLLFGKPCPTDDSVCQGTGDKNAAPTCRKGNNPSEVKAVVLEADPAAYCTGSCTTDNDCPLPMKCAADFDGVTKCLKRDVCDECKYDENCGYTSGNFRSDFNRCVPTRDGTSHYCSKECLSAADCPGAAKKSKWMVCEPSTNSDGVEGTYCLHWYGACVGTGEVCDPCRSQDDCGTGLKCMDNPYGLFSYPWSGERMCNKTCMDDSDCGGPNNSVCDNSDPNNSILKCTNTHSRAGVFACNK